MSGLGWFLQVLALVIVGSAFVLGMTYDQIRLELAVAAGGDHFHAGGKHWKSQDDPEWQTLSAWVQGRTLGGAK